jgi:NAD(P)-dependent dehydrogenase (short-subunit alcohol dehydrogenase family)
VAEESALHVITGATAGIGHAVAQRLASAGDAVVLICRDRARADAARDEIRRTTPTATVDVRIADLSSLADVRRLAGELRSAHPRITSLTNSAAVYSSRRVETAEGLELMFATNHLGPFLLTNLLLPSLQMSSAARVITLTAPATNQIDFEDLQATNRFRSLNVFGATKAANLLFTFELARRLQGTGVTANAVHPGVTRTGLMRQGPPPLRFVMRFFAAPPEHAAGDIAPLLTDERYAAETGQFFRKGKPMDPPPYTRDVEIQQRLWDVSEQLAELAA